MVADTPFRCHTNLRLRLVRLDSLFYLTWQKETELFKRMRTTSVSISYYHDRDSNNLVMVGLLRYTSICDYSWVKSPYEHMPLTTANYSKRDAFRGISQSYSVSNSKSNSILLPFPGVFPADAFRWGVSTFVVLRFPGPFELGHVISEDISGSQSRNEVVELSLLSVSESTVAWTVAVAMPVAIWRVLAKRFANWA